MTCWRVNRALGFRFFMLPASPLGPSSVGVDAAEWLCPPSTLTSVPGVTGVARGVSVALTGGKAAVHRELRGKNSKSKNRISVSATEKPVKFNLMILSASAWHYLMFEHIVRYHNNSNITTNNTDRVNHASVQLVVLAYRRQSTSSLHLNN
eukprot:scpid77077/ scgid4151/ 